MTLMENTTTRTLKEIDQEYVNTCAELGHRQVQIEMLQEQISKITTKLVTLREESAALPKDQATPA